MTRSTLSRKHDGGFGSLPEIAVREVELCRLMRDWNAIQQIIDRQRASEMGSSFLLTMHLTEVAIATGLFEKAQIELDGVVSSTIKERSHQAHLRGRLADAKFDHETAAKYYAAAIRLDPQNAGLQFDMARVKLLTLELDASLEHLRAFTRLTRSWLLGRNLSTNLSQNHVGQLIDEFRTRSGSTKRTPPIAPPPAFRATSTVTSFNTKIC